MIPPPINNSPFYNVTSKIESNAILNRGLMEACGYEIPFAIMANNKDERKERFMRATWFIISAFVAPVITMPLINKLVLRHFIKDLAPEEIHILKVSKKYLTENTAKMREGFEKPAYTNIKDHFDNLLKRFDNEILRKRLIKAHENIFIIDFAISAILGITNHWVSTSLTAKRTGREGYVGEFNMADKKYTDKMSEKHRKTKNIKMISAYIIGIASAIIFPKLLARSMMKNASELGSVGKFFKNKAHLFEPDTIIFTT